MFCLHSEEYYFQGIREKRPIFLTQARDSVTVRVRLNVRDYRSLTPLQL